MTEDLRRWAVEMAFRVNVRKGDLRSCSPSDLSIELAELVTNSVNKSTRHTVQKSFADALLPAV